LGRGANGAPSQSTAFGTQATINNWLALSEMMSKADQATIIHKRCFLWSLSPKIAGLQTLLAKSHYAPRHE
jgi:hypothetical protein